jgi:thiol:disulfide interchange protein DsbD
MAHKMRMRPPQPGHSQARTSTWNTRRSIAGQDRRVRGLGAAVLGAEATSPERGIARGSGSSSAPAVSSGGAPVLSWAVVRTRVELDAALGRARAQGRPALLEFYASWCSDCRELDEKVFRREDIRRALGRFATIRVDATRVTDELRALGRSYGMSGVPGLVFVGSDGRVREDATLRGPVPAEPVLRRLE